MSGGQYQQGGGPPNWQQQNAQPTYQGQRSNVNPWSGMTPAQGYPGQNMQNFLNLYQYRPFPRAHFTNQPQGTTATPPPTAPAQPPPTQPGVPTWGGNGMLTQLLALINNAGGATYPGARNTEPVVQQPNGAYQPGVDPNAGVPATGLKAPVRGMGGSVSAPPPSQPGTAVRPGQQPGTGSPDYMTQFGNLMAEDPRLAYGFTYGGPQQAWFQQNQLGIRDKFFGGNQDRMNAMMNESAYANPLTPAERQRLGI